MCAFHGQMGMFVRALTYMLSHGGDGLRQVAEDAVLIGELHPREPEGRSDVARRSATGPACTRRCSTTTGSKDTGVTTLDFAKAMIDEGYHPMTVYFPLVVHGAMLIEPTESEIESLARSVHRGLARSRAGGEARRHRRALPARLITRPRRRLDETRAARQPVLRWTKPAPQKQAAE